MLIIDKMFEYDFGIDYSDRGSLVQEISRKLSTDRENRSRERHNEVLIEVHKNEQSFWYSLIKEDILNKV